MDRKLQSVPTLRRKLAYVGHAFHLRTRSTEFLIHILEQHFDVVTLAVDPEKLNEATLDLSTADIDIVLVFQLDFLAPIFIAQQIRTVVVPMFDGSANMPEAHWQLSNQARFVSFSRQLHVNMQRAGSNSLLVKYFPEPSAAPGRRFRTLNGYFWERRPDTGIDVRLLERVLGTSLAKLHVHRVPDTSSVLDGQPTPKIGDAVVTTSTWFKDRSDIQRIMTESNVYFAPRLSEGIGMGFLEAMASGMLVVAHDASTHNEYIANWENGILFATDIGSPASVTPELAYELGQAAKDTIADGRPKWLAQIPEMVQWIEETPVPQATGIDGYQLGVEIRKSYSAGFGSYSQFLKRNVPLVRRMSPALDAKRKIAAENVRLETEDDVSVASPLTVTTLPFGTPAGRRFLINGWSHDEAGFVWIEGTAALIRFANSPAIADATTMILECHAPGFLNDQKLAVVLNGTLCGVVNVTPEISSHAFTLEPPGLKMLNDLRLFASDSGKPPGADLRVLSVAVSALVFK